MALRVIYLPTYIGTAPGEYIHSRTLGHTAYPDLEFFVILACCLLLYVIKQSAVPAKGRIDRVSAESADGRSRLDRA